MTFSMTESNLPRPAGSEGMPSSSSSLSPVQPGSRVRDLVGWRLVWLVLYYSLVLLGLLAIHASGSFQTPTFIYQGF